MKAGSYYQHQLNSFLIFVLVVMSFFMGSVMLSMFYVISQKHVVRYLGHQKAGAEQMALIFSTSALLMMSIPSAQLLYSAGSISEVGLTVKVVGSQWYWSFEVADMMEEPCLMYMLSTEDLQVGEVFLLEVDNRLVIPVDVVVQFVITSSDVIHSFSMPTLGMKVDATPGLLTTVHCLPKKIGVHYGQCSEICGTNHAFMPFVLEVVPFQSFLHWVILQEEESV